MTIIISGGGSGGVTSIAGNAGAFTLSNGITNSTNDIRLNIGHLPGEPSTGSAASGEIGETISASLAKGSAAALTSATTLNVTSISLTAGDWEVWGRVYFTGGATTTVNRASGSISTTTATENRTAGFFGTVVPAGQAPFAFEDLTAVCGPVRVSLSGTTTHFLTAVAAFGTSTASAYGFIEARRMR